MDNMKPLLVLDVDGVIRACTEIVSCEQLSHDTGFTIVEQTVKTNSRFIEHDFRYAPELIERLKALSLNVDIVFASSWNEKTQLLEQIDFCFPYADTSENVGFDWFNSKIKSALKNLKEHYHFSQRPCVVWVDDDFDTHVREKRFLYSEHSNIRLFSPALTRGITVDMLKDIENILL